MNNYSPPSHCSPEVLVCRTPTALTDPLFGQACSQTAGVAAAAEKHTSECYWTQWAQGAEMLTNTTLGRYLKSMLETAQWIPGAAISEAPCIHTTTMDSNNGS